MPYEAVFSTEALDDLRRLSAYDRMNVLAAIDLHLTHSPQAESRSRIKRLTQPAISEFRLRVGDFRVYYDVIEDDKRVLIVEVYDKGTRPTPRGDA